MFLITRQCPILLPSGQRLIFVALGDQNPTPEWFAFGDRRYMG